MRQKIKKILIANRGEIALRIIQTCKDMGIATVAVYSVADKNSLYVKFADEAVCIGESPSSESYLNIGRIISAVEITGADAIHPGYGFLAENASFAKLCTESGIIFIGPDSSIMSLMSDKVAAKKQMNKLNVPTIPGSEGAVKNITEAIDIANKIGFPIIIKSIFGGGGRGITLVKSKEEIALVWEKAKKETLESFGNEDLYIEKYIENARHIEVQILEDNYGNITCFPERDCSVQRRHQKLIEETPAQISTDTKNKILFTTIEALKNIKYTGAGTVEYIVDNLENFYFMEMNTRIQVEHGITEVSTGVDLIREQIRIAEEEKIINEIKSSRYHVIECRINSEDPENDFMPSCGNITALHIPTGLGVRVDTHIYTGYKISHYYDSLLAKLIVYGNDRKECLKRTKRALSEFVIEGVKTTIPFCIDYINNELKKE